MSAHLSDRPPSTKKSKKPKVLQGFWYFFLIFSFLDPILAYLGSTWPPRRLQDAFESAQDAPKRLQETSRRLQDAFMSAQDASKSLQDVPKRPQDASKTIQDAPRHLQDASKTVQDGPRRLQDDSKTPPGAPKTTPRGFHTPPSRFFVDFPPSFRQPNHKNQAPARARATFFKSPLQRELLFRCLDFHNDYRIWSDLGASLASKICLNPINIDPGRSRETLSRPQDTSKNARDAQERLQ